MCQVMSPYVVVQNVQAEAERSLSEEIPVTGELEEGTDLV